MAKETKEYNPKTDFDFYTNRSSRMTDLSASDEQSIDSLSFSLSKSIADLEFISTLEKGHKPLYNSRSTIQRTAWFATFQRRWAGEKGEKGLIYVNNVLDSCDRYYRMCLSDSSIYTDDIFKYNITKNLSSLRTALKNSVQGFNNLIMTYDDQETVAKGYDKCKNRVTKIIDDINIFFNRLLSSINEFNSDSEIIEHSSECYFPSDDEYYDEYYDNNNNKPMISSLEVSSESVIKPSFFTSSNIVLGKI